ncbi:MAG: 3-dehydroquinate synthase II [Methanosarcinaceae archaeon]|nr:3-dehydroquinate synthase II [Methanosarcinaceae archaeon]
MKNKTVWVKADIGSIEDKKNKITMGLESGADYVLIDKSDIENVRKLGKIKIAAFVSDFHDIPDADILVIGKNGEGDGTKPLPSDFTGSMDLITADALSKKGVKVAGFVIIRNKKYEEFAAELGKVCDYLIVIGTDWKIIPLENLIANLTNENINIITGVGSSDEAKLALETMEHGSEGVLLDTDDLSQIKSTATMINKHPNSDLDLVSASIIEVRQVGMGDRVCIDTCNIMEKGEGMLIGSKSTGMFLVNSESEESPYVASRPFRVNAGAVHAYILIGDKTRYLSELKAGDAVTIVNLQGNQRDGIVGRSKIERRPMMLVEAKVDDIVVSAILQNAETIKLVGSDGELIPVTELKNGDEVLVRIEDGARHFGMNIEETIIEK